MYDELINKVLLENGNGHRYLKMLLAEGKITELDEKLVLLLVSLRTAEQKLDAILKHCE